MTSNLGSESFKRYEKPLGFGQKTLGEVKQMKGEVDESGRGAIFARVP